VGEFENKGLNLGLGRMQFGVATGDLPQGFGGVGLGLIEQLPYGANDPVREFRSRVETGQISVLIHAAIVAASSPQSLMNRSFQR